MATCHKCFPSVELGLLLFLTRPGPPVPLSPRQTLLDVFPACAPRVLSGSEAFVATTDVRRLSSLLLVAGVAIAGCGSTVDDQDAGPQCAAGELFVYDDGLCGEGSSAGWCAPNDDGCTPDYPVCGCDGIAYPTSCETKQKGMDTTFADQCTAPSGMFACGYDFCARNTMYCNEIVFDSEGFSEFFCDIMMPQCASAPSCECIDDWVGDECESDGMGGFYTTHYVYTD